MNRKIITACIAVLGIIIFCTSASSALLTDTRIKENNFTFGNNTIATEEVFDVPEKYQSDTTYRKQITVKNTGSIPCYVRVFAEPSNSEIPVSIDYDEGHWKKSGDWWYYDNVLQPGESTSALFDSVYIGEIDDDHKESFDIIVYSESVQSEGFEDAPAAFEEVDA